MRALLIVNPNATSTTRQRRDVIARALASVVDLEVVQTRYRGDAAKLAATAAAEKFGLVMTLGGDGTVNEAVNGLLGGHRADRQVSAPRSEPRGNPAPPSDSAPHGNPAPGSASAPRGNPAPGSGSAPGSEPAGNPAPGGASAPRSEPAGNPAPGSGSVTRGNPAAGKSSDLLPGAGSNAATDGTANEWDRPLPPASDLPALAALPGGSANVFTRTLNLPTDPVDAAGRLIEDLASGRERCIGLGVANGRYFTFNAGLGLDGEVVRAVEGRRAHGQPVTPTLFARTALRQYYQLTDRRQPAISIGDPPALGAHALYLCIVSNSAPWTFLGSRPVNTNPQAGFDTGLDLLGFRSLGTFSTLRILRQMLSDRTEPPQGRSVVAAHDLPVVNLQADRPVAFQVDGEYMGEVEHASFQAVPRALRVIGLWMGQSSLDLHLTCITKRCK